MHNQQCEFRCVITGVCMCACVYERESEGALGDLATASCSSPPLPEQSIPDAAEPLSSFCFHLLPTFIHIPLLSPSFGRNGLPIIILVLFNIFSYSQENVLNTVTI